MTLYTQILTALDISPHLVANAYAEQILETSSESEQEFHPDREKSRSSDSKLTSKRDYEETGDETTDTEATKEQGSIS